MISIIFFGKKVRSYSKNKEELNIILKYQKIFNDEWNKRIYNKYMILSKDKSLTPRNIKATDNLRGNILKRKISESFLVSKEKNSFYLII